MEIEEELKSNGIEVIEKLDDETIKSIAEFVASGICNTFPKLHFNIMIYLMKSVTYLCLLLTSQLDLQKPVIFIKIHLFILETEWDYQI